LLTGESTPLIKSHIPHKEEYFNHNEHQKHILYAGTKIVQKRQVGEDKVYAVVLSTGFKTEKGNLIRSILFPKESEFKFKKDSISFIYFMGCMALIGYFASFPFAIKNGTPPMDLFFRFFDLITTTVPPALPACLGIGITYALSRLKKYGIICINRDRINIAGRVNMICFDKTGTLTEDHLDIFGFRPIVYSTGQFQFDKFIFDTKQIVDDNYSYFKAKIVNEDEYNKSKEIKSLLLECMATCHSITMVKGDLLGDPIDLRMFEATGWSLIDNVDNEGDEDIVINSLSFNNYKFLGINIC